MSMQPLNFEEVRQYVSRNIVIFHQNKINKIARLKLKDLIRRKNPYVISTRFAVSGCKTQNFHFG
jgi:hypothetical protein